MTRSIDDQEHEHEKGEQTTFETYLPSLSQSVPSVRIRFTFELVNERRCLTQPFEPLLGGESIKLSVAVEILRFALSQRALEFCGRPDFSLLRFHFGAAISPVLLCRSNLCLATE